VQKYDGIEPLRWLLAKFKFSKEDKFENDEGRIPVSLF